MNNYFSRYVHSALMGDKTAYETLYNLTKDALFFAILNITKNEQEAISIMKESYTNAFENLTSLKKAEIFDVWLNRIASYSAYISITEKNPDAFNNVAEKFEWNDEDNFDQLPQETIDDKDTRNVVKGIIENLPDDQRLLIIMHYYQEMSLSAIVSTLDLPENTVMCILSYAREGIKKEIAKAESEGRLMRSVSLGAVPFTLMELAKSQFLFHPAPPMSSIITPPTNAEPIIEEKNDIQAILNIPSPDASKEQAQETKITEQVQEPVQQEYANPYEQAQQPVQQEYANPYEQAQQPVQQEYSNPYEQAQQPVQQEYANPYEQAQQPVQQEYANPYEQAQQPVQQEYANPYEQAQQPVQQEYANPYEQAQQPVQQEYANPYEQAQQPVQQETVVEQSQNVQEVSEQPSNNIPKKPQSYQRVVEANFSIDNATKQKNKKTDKQNSSLSKIGNFFKSTAGIATIIGVAFVVIAGVVIFSMLDVAKKNSLSTDGIIESSVDINASSDSESSHEPTAEELRAAELKEDEKNYVYKEYQNDTLHIVGYKGKLEDLVIPEKYSNKVITGIDPMAFSGCSQIKSVTISKNIQSISLNNRSCNMNPFYDCIYMKNIYVDEDNRYFTSVDGVLYNKSKTELLFYPSYKSDSSYTILDSVTKIEVGAFQRNGIVTEVILPKNIKTISKEAFLECTSLQKIEIPSGITEISESLFLGCKSLNDITLPNTIKEIKSNAFYKCSGLRKITLPESVETLNFLAFGDCTMLNTCTIENSNMKFKSSYDKNESIFPNTQVTLRAKKGSTTEAYAKKWKMYFSYI
ncbi:leucine-rich repeat protein [Pseudoruminococcus massiliensis]|uniref:leucine-rich repeat protein n=1 Tax=Pseudoruminococcus massiliensis TaxID=2086583 RepID=UPI000D0E7FA2|nr:leucine-rich repeat protein [Pseudoruminococcus massiliensis]